MRLAQHIYENLDYSKSQSVISSSKNQLGQWQSFIDYELEREAYQENY
ncbi:hypothetical protein ABE099_10100 [Paenibacillus turicensis]